MTDLRTLHVRDGNSADLLTQAVDLNDDGTFDELIFQLDLRANETRTLDVTVGERRIPAREDFRGLRAIQPRTPRRFRLGERSRRAPDVWGGARDLEAGAVDQQCPRRVGQRTPRLIVNDWYMVDDYHRDTGEGADLYSAGRTRGCGGSGLWRDGRLYASPNFRNTRVLAQGPIRVLFELNVTSRGRWVTPKVAEVKRVSLDAGHHFNRFELTLLSCASGRHAARRRDPEQPGQHLQGRAGGGCCAAANPSRTTDLSAAR